jgi:hypothetical protein
VQGFKALARSFDPGELLPITVMLTAQQGNILDDVNRIDQATAALEGARAWDLEGSTRTFLWAELKPSSTSSPRGWRAREGTIWWRTFSMERATRRPPPWWRTF